MIDEKDYIRYSQKFIKERTQIEENIDSLKRKMNAISSAEKNEITNQEVKEKVENFLKTENVNKEILFEIVDRIEIDELKRIYVHFNFEQLNVYETEEIYNVSIS